MRVLVVRPPARQLAVMRAWLDASYGPQGWSCTAAGLDGVVNDAIAFYFADPDHARAFVDRFSCGYRVARAGCVLRDGAPAAGRSAPPASLAR